MLIVNQDLTEIPNDNQWGGELILNFSAFGPVTMELMRVLDIDAYYIEAVATNNAIAYPTPSQIKQP